MHIYNNGNVNNVYNDIMYIYTTYIMYNVVYIKNNFKDVNNLLKQKTILSKLISYNLI